MGVTLLAMAKRLCGLAMNFLVNNRFFGAILAATSGALFLCPSPVRAQEADVTQRWSISWNECLREAYQKHPSLVSARENIKAALADKRSAVGVYLPQVSANANQNVTNSGHTKHTYSTDYNLSYNQLLFDSFKTPANIFEQNHVLNSVREAYRAASADALHELRSSFIEVMRSNKLVEITEEIASRRRINVNLVKLRYDAGRENKGSLLRAEATLAQAEFEIEQARRALRVNQRKLNQALGRADFSPLIPEENFEAPEKNGSMDAELEPILERQPTLLQAIETRKSRRWDVVSKWAAFFPTFNLSLSEQVGGEEWHAIKTHSWSVLVRGQVPLFEGGTQFFDLSKAKATYKAALASEHRTRDTVVYGIESQWAATMDAVAFVKVQLKFLEAADLRAQIMATQYASGTASFEDWNLIEDDLVNARKAYLNAQRDALLAKARWLQAQGVGFENILPKL